MEPILKEFKKRGLDASFHYADDTGKEWYLGDKERNEAMRIFNENPELQDEMKKIAKDFLWSLDRELSR